MGDNWINNLTFRHDLNIPARLKHSGTTLTFRHDFNIPAWLQHSGMTSTFRHDFNSPDTDSPGPNPQADMDPPSQICTPFQTFLLSILCIISGNKFYLQAFCRCSFQWRHNIPPLRWRKTAISFQFCHIYYSESYSIRRN